MLRQRGIEFDYRYFEVDESDTIKVIEAILDDVEGWGGEVYFEAVGGVRSIVTSMVVAAFLLGEKVKEIYTIAETKGKRVKVYVPPLWMPPLDLKDKRTLKYILEHSGAGLGDIADNIGIPKSTLSRRLRDLEKAGLVKRVKTKPAEYNITLLGRLILKRN